MYDSFTADLEKDNADESNKQKAHEELMATKKQELKTLEATLEKQELDAASATKTLADSKETLDDTKETLEADEAFFADSKEACQSKAGMYSERTRLRTEELAGMEKAIQILSSDSAKAVFKNATTTFLQISSAKTENSNSNKAYMRIRSLATTYKSTMLAKIAVAIKTGGHFDIITAIDNMISTLRKEDMEDIYHRDRCEAKQNANANSKDDLEAAMTKTKEAIGRMENTETELKNNLKKSEEEIASTKKAMEELLNMRNKEEADFQQALKDDAAAVELLGQAIEALSKFYTDNKITLVQKHKAPEYSKDEDKPPEVFEDDNYGGQRSSTGGIVAILGMLKEDLEKEMKTGRADDAEGQASYEKDNSALEDTLDAQTKKKTDIETDLAELGSKIEDYKEFSKQKSSDLDAEKDTEKSLMTDCAWVKANFKKRAEKRKLEMDGLVEAKNFLAGVDSGEAVLPP
jgi:hypothetical protein